MPKEEPNFKIKTNTASQSILNTNLDSSDYKICFQSNIFNDQQQVMNSKDFQYNPLLSNSKQQILSPNRYEQKLSNLDKEFDQSIARISSPNKSVSQDETIADESRSPSPLPKVNKFQVGISVPSMKIFKQKKSAEPNNFHDNYLKLGLWPEMNYEKQAQLRNNYRKLNRMMAQGCQSQLNLHQQQSYMYSSISNIQNTSVLPPSGRNKANSILLSQESIPIYQQMKQNKHIYNSFYSNRCVQCSTTEAHSDKDESQYKEGLKKALDLINTLLDQVANQQQTPNKNNNKTITLQDHIFNIDKENMPPSMTFNKSNRNPNNKKTKKLNLTSKQELQSLVKVIKKAKATNESLYSSRNNLSRVYESMNISNRNEQLPPKSQRNQLNQTRRSNSLMKQVLNRLHKLNNCTKGLTNEQKDDINQSVLQLCDLIM